MGVEKGKKFASGPSITFISFILSKISFRFPLWSENLYAENDFGLYQIGTIRKSIGVKSIIKNNNKIEAMSI